MITRVYGTCNEFDIEFSKREGSDLEIWDAIVPASPDGIYVCEIYAESSSGMSAYAATVVFLISGHDVKGKLVPRGFHIESDNLEYNSLLNKYQMKGELDQREFESETKNAEYASLLDIDELIGEIFARCFSGEKLC